MVAHLANMGREATLAAGATKEHAQATTHKAAEEALVGANASPVRD